MQIELQTPLNFVPYFNATQLKINALIKNLTIPLPVYFGLFCDVY